MIKEPPRAWSGPQILIYLFSIIGFFCSTMNGYDGSLINNLLQNPWFKDEYHVQNTGIWTGIITSMYQIGGVVALPFVGPAIDTWGRRIGMLIGALLIIVGTIIQGTSHASGQFMGGRFLVRLLMIPHKGAYVLTRRLSLVSECRSRLQLARCTLLRLTTRKSNLVTLSAPLT
jgi:MFS family permease